MWRIVLVFLAFNFLFSAVLGLGEKLNPPNNSIVTERIGAVNITFECEITLESGRVGTAWSVRNFRGETGSQLLGIPGNVLFSNIIISGKPTNGTLLSTTFQNRLTFINFIESLDGVTLFCGSGTILEAGRFFLRVYREPVLKNLLDTVMFQVGGNLIFNMELDIPAHPFPTTFQWSKNGVENSSNDSRVTFGYPFLIINNAMPSDSGVYSLTATNYLLDNSSTVLGTDRGEIDLDFLFGPSIELGPEQRVIRVGEPLTLVCGTKLLSNPQSIIRWIDNGGVNLTGGSRINPLTMDMLISLEFSNTVFEDTGTWTCIVTVAAFNVTDSSSESEIIPSVKIGEVIFNISLIVLVAPGIPRNLTIDRVGSTWVTLCWQLPIDEGRPGISNYSLSGTAHCSIMIYSLSPATNFFNATGLSPLTSYSFRVQAISSALDDGNLLESRGGFSDSAITTTNPDVPAVICNMTETTSRGIMIYWQFIHTGGLNITSINITYTINDEATIQRGPEVNENDTTAFIPAVDEDSYNIMVTATNTEGSASAECPLVTFSVTTVDFQVFTTQSTTDITNTTEFSGTSPVHMVKIQLITILLSLASAIHVLNR